MLTCEQISSAERSLWAKSFNSLRIPRGKAVLIALLLAYTCCAGQPALPSIPAPRGEPKGHPGTRGWPHAAASACPHGPRAAPKPARSQAGTQEPEPAAPARLGEQFAHLPCQRATQSCLVGRVPSVLWPPLLRGPAGERPWFQRLSAKKSWGATQGQNTQSRKVPKDRRVLLSLHGHRPKSALGRTRTRDREAKRLPGASRGTRCAMPLLPSSSPRGRNGCENLQEKLQYLLVHHPDNTKTSSDRRTGDAGRLCPKRAGWPARWRSQVGARVRSRLHPTSLSPEIHRGPTTAPRRPRPQRACSQHQRFPVRSRKMLVNKSLCWGSRGTDDKPGTDPPRQQGQSRSDFPREQRLRSYLG